MKIQKKSALRYHSHPRPGKISIAPTKPSDTQIDLSLAYSPGVAEACLEIVRDPRLAGRYTSRSNLVAVVSNGSAVLGLGNIGPLAGKPVMEGKAVLFKRFADIDVFDLELNTADPDEIIRVVELLEPTFGGINLEDIKAPECFHVEEELRKRVSIPVFHDDQHGTAIISGAALINAAEIAGKDLRSLRVVINGAGASGIACADLYLKLGVDPSNLLLLDSRGVIHTDRVDGMNRFKERFAADTGLRALEEATKGADVFVGLSKPDVLTTEMLLSMADSPIVFALANPDPEIEYGLATATRKDAIIATGRSDHPNQVNNVLCFPSLFRGALDVEATSINAEMELAAVRALADLARDPVPDSVRRIYTSEQLGFGPQYIIPKPFDPRVTPEVASKVAEVAISSGAATKRIELEDYRQALTVRLDSSQEVFQMILDRAKEDPRRLVMPEGDHEKILRAAFVLNQERIARPVLLGDPEQIRRKAEELMLPTDGWEIVEPQHSPRLEQYAQDLFRLRQRKGCTYEDALEMLRDRIAFACMMVRSGDADGVVAGITRHYPETLRTVLRIIDRRSGVRKVSGLYMMIRQRKIYLLADTTVNIDPSPEDLAEIAMLAARRARRLGIVPHVALLSFSNFGSARNPDSERVTQAAAICSKLDPGLIVDGEMQADTALDPDISEEFFPFSRLQSEANVLIFPNLAAANIAYKLLRQFAGARSVGPILMGMAKPVAVLQKGFNVEEVITMSAVAVHDAQEGLAARSAVAAD
ncbi:MAG: NADP-dependent malic enzyme [Bryobacterales bacterium]|nr:NADP-dependent malic enzyme [Bryobacterales bacterium]MDE0621688.1 NADP-dependent malic enzyme [Bryobacterales bacterium]